MGGFFHLGPRPAGFFVDDGMSLYTLTVDLLLKSGSFERDSGKAARVVKRDMDTIQSSMEYARRVLGQD